MITKNPQQTSKSWLEKKSAKERWCMSVPTKSKLENVDVHVFHQKMCSTNYDWLTLGTNLGEILIKIDRSHFWKGL